MFLSPEYAGEFLSPAYFLPQRSGVPAEVIDIVYQGAQTRYWVKAKDHRINIVTQHNRCYLDYKQPTWGDKVWVAWHRDDVTTLPEEAPH